MDYLLSEEQIMIRDLCRQIADEKIRPVAAEFDKTEEFPTEIMKVLAKSDLFCIFIPEEFGGSGISVLNLCIATEELSKACGGISVCYAASALGTFPIIQVFLPTVPLACFISVLSKYQIAFPPGRSEITSSLELYPPSAKSRGTTP